ncbi:glycosyltransferase [Pontibacter sp. KCTC 32443]|uniref:glycosyltransferase n=1 Tax=Pontibacter TaxID=323449 RepID=UPI00164D2AE7|nr:MULTISPECIES: glycosyltransferase [Pontibacter]MBC5774946.1 glycosyltransferase [Pontibacter sp. KCTC 32443]
MIVSVIYFIVYFSIFLALLGLLLFNRRRYTLTLTEEPRISILIAARNEEHTIMRCLLAIDALNYPKNKIEVLIGNDASTDRTRLVIEGFIKDKPNYSCIDITGNIGNARGKANVLAHLAKHATTDYYFYTDADIAVPETWVQAMLSEMKENVGVVTGITTITGNHFFHKMQALDWLYALGLMQVVSDIGLPVSTMGNNMLLRRQAYESVGGFESIRFSITEDIAIFNEILNKGWSFSNIYTRHTLAFSLPAASLGQYMHQRKRWMSGSMHLPLYMAIILILHSAYYPVLIPFFAYTSVGVMGAIFTLKMLFQSLFVHICLRRLNLAVPWLYYLLFELYLVVSSVILIIYFFLPVKTIWKGRKY